MKAALPPTRIYVNLAFQAETNSLPMDEWQEFEIHGLMSSQSPEAEAICFALETQVSHLPANQWPTIAYATREEPKHAFLCTCYRIEVC